MTLDEVKELLRSLGFPTRLLKDPTVLTLLALADSQPRTGLLQGHGSLAEGARVHDILNFIRDDFQKPVAESTRESYRKTSLRPLIDAGWVIRHQLSTNDPKTYYRLHEELLRLLRTEPGPEQEQLASQLHRKNAASARSQKSRPGSEGVGVRIGSQEFQLSPGAHNELEKEVVEQLAPAILIDPAVVYLGDTAPRAGYQNRTLMRRLNLPIDVTSSLPDVVVLDQLGQLLIVEAVTSSGVIDERRLEQLQAFAKGASAQGIRVTYLTAFPNRRTFRRFVEEIAWGTKVWISQ